MPSNDSIAWSWPRLALDLPVPAARIIPPPLAGGPFRPRRVRRSMTFDEQLQRSLATLADHLRDEIARACQARAPKSPLMPARRATPPCKTPRRASRRGGGHGARRDRPPRTADAEITAAFASLEQQRAADVAASERLVDAVRALDRAPSLSEILDALVDGASREAARVGLLLARHGRPARMAILGFGPTVDPARSLVVRIEESGIVGEAVRTGAAVSSESPGALAGPCLRQVARRSRLPGGARRLSAATSPRCSMRIRGSATKRIGDRPRSSGRMRWSCSRGMPRDVSKRPPRSRPFAS